MAAVCNYVMYSIDDVKCESVVILITRSDKILTDRLGGGRKHCRKINPPTIQRICNMQQYIIECNNNDTYSLSIASKQ